MIPAQMGFGFERPLLMAVGIIVIPLALYLARKLGSPFAASLPLGPPGGVPFTAPFNLGRIVTALRMIEYFSIFLLFVCASGPQIKIAETVWLNRGADILFVLDISPSMAALDMGGSNRYNVARKLLKDFAEHRPADSIGLAAVGYDAALLVPPTTDRALLYSRLDELQIGEMGDGTALGMGIAVAAYHLEKSTAPRRAAVLISDGENKAGAIHPETAAAMFKKIGASLWVIGIGSGGEVPIDYIDPFTRIRRTGLFDSRYDTEALRRMSAAGGGIWIPAPSADALAAAFTRLDSQEMVVRRSGIVTRSLPCHLPFMITALGLITIVHLIRRFFLGAWL
jgi:Ca-activated chloride channel family protein